MNLDLYLDLGAEFATAWRRGGKVRLALWLAVILVTLAIVVISMGVLFSISKQILEPLAGGLAVTGVLLLLAVGSYERSLRRVAAIDKIERAERRVEEHPRETHAAWELAQIKLETYLNRNLSQIQSIYWLTVLVMTVGFILIGIGVIKAYSSPETLPGSVLSATSGVLVSFIGGSFLLIFRSTVDQAKEYMSILERINAVGMAVQILDSLEGTSGDIKDQTTAELARDLLKMYSPTN